MLTTKEVLATLLMLCASSLVQGQEPQLGPQSEEQQLTRRIWEPFEEAAELKRLELTAANSTSAFVTPAIEAVKTSFMVYPDVVGAKPLPTTGKWSIPAIPALKFLPACKASKAFCLEVEYSVPARDVVCHWTVLFPPATLVKGKELQTPEVINEDANAARYTMMFRLQKGMFYAPVRAQSPVYPKGAKAADWTGAVSVQVVISPEGEVVSMPDVRGPALLQSSAKQAVAKWVYAPTKLGGEDVARTFTVRVNFSVGGETIKRK